MTKENDEFYNREGSVDIGKVKVKRSDVVGTPSDNPNEDDKIIKPSTIISTNEDAPPLVRTKTKTSIGFVHNHVYLTTVASVIIGENIKRNSIMIRNLGAETVWVGESGVSAGTNGNGWPIETDEVLVLDYSYGAIYGIVEQNTGVVAIIEE